MLIRGVFVIGFALIIDALQAALGWMFLTLGAGLQALTPVGGAVAGGALGCGAGWSASTNVVAGAIACVKGGVVGGFIGAAASAFGVPMGVALAFASDVCISLTMGSGLILLLALNGMFYPGYIGAVFIGEAIPGLDIIPGWTLLAIRCVLKKTAEEKNGIAGLASGLASAALSPQSASGFGGLAMKGISNMKTATSTMARSNPRTRAVYESEPVQEVARQRQQLAADVGREIKTLPTNNLHAKTT